MSVKCIPENRSFTRTKYGVKPKNQDMAGDSLIKAYIYILYILAICNLINYVIKVDLVMLGI